MEGVVTQSRVFKDTAEEVQIRPQKLGTGEKAYGNENTEQIESFKLESTLRKVDPRIPSHHPPCMHRTPGSQILKLK